MNAPVVLLEGYRDGRPLLLDGDGRRIAGHEIINEHIAVASTPCEKQEEQPRRTGNARA